MREVQSGVHEPGALHLQPRARQRWRLQVSKAPRVALPLLLLLLPISDCSNTLLRACCIGTLLYNLLEPLPIMQESIWCTFLQVSSSAGQYYSVLLFLLCPWLWSESLLLQVSGVLRSDFGAHAVLQQQRHSWWRAGHQCNSTQAGYHHSQPVCIQQRSSGGRRGG